MTWTTEGGPERLGRRLGRAVVRGRVMARQLADPATREQLTRAGRRAAERAEPKIHEAADRARQELASRGPDAAEQVAQRAVDRVLWGLGGRSGVLTAVIRPLAQPARHAAGNLARDLAEAAGGREHPRETSATDTAPPALGQAADEGETGAGESDPPASRTS